MAFVLAGNGIYVAKQAGSAMTGKMGSADLIRAFGVNISKLNDPEKVKEILEKLGIVLFFIPFLTPDLRYRATFTPKLAQLGLRYYMPFHLAAFAWHPMNLTRRIYGVYSERYVKVLAELFQKLGYEKGLVFCGAGDIPEISNIGPTQIVEYTSNTLKEYIVTPQDLGVKQVTPEQIEVDSPEVGIVDFLKVIYGRDRGPKSDLVAINAASALYILDKVKSIREGVDIAYSALKNGRASAKFEEYVATLGNIDELHNWKQKAGI